VTNSQRCLDRLSHHANRVDKLIRLLGDPVGVDRSREPLDDLTQAMYREIRFELKREYDAGEDKGTWSKADAVSLTALYDAYAALGAGTLRPQRMLNNAHRARRVLASARLDIEHQSGK
jgi:hypothetical protein